MAAEAMAAAASDPPHPFRPPSSQKGNGKVANTPTRPTEVNQQEHGSMATELPVRIEFSLPDGWQAAPPDEVGAPDVAFVALRRTKAADGPNGFTTNLTIAGEHRDPTIPITTIADESLHRLESVAKSVRVRDRTNLGPNDTPGMTQVLDIELNKGKPLVQCQVYLPLEDAHNPSRQAVLELVLTCTSDQLAEALPDFQRFVETVRPAPAG
jgi:hypothetical protein